MGLRESNLSLTLKMRKSLLSKTFCNSCDHCKEAILSAEVDMDGDSELKEREGCGSPVESRTESSDKGSKDLKSSITVSSLSDMDSPLEILNGNTDVPGIQPKANKVKKLGDLVSSNDNHVEDEEMRSGGQQAQRRSPLQIIMLVFGTRGDVQPFIAIGKRLKEDGHRIRLATHANFRNFVLSNGLEFYPLGADPKFLCRLIVERKGNLIPTPSIGLIERKQLIEFVSSLVPACTNPDIQTGIPFKADAIIANPIAYGQVHVAEALNVPLQFMFVSPWTPTDEISNPFSRIRLRIGRKLSYELLNILVWLAIRDSINKIRKKDLKLRPATYLFGQRRPALNVPITYAWSPSLLPKPKDWGSNVEIVGSCLLNSKSNYEPPKELKIWLENDKKPFYFGFGSIPVPNPEKITKIIVEALEITGQRGIISKGWGGLGKLANSKEFIYLIDDCPHDWLFLHCAGVVHHGGTSTTAASLKAACPTTIVPFFGDQFIWGERIYHLGLGAAPIKGYKFSLQKLVNAIYFMLNPMVKERATELSKIMESENGVERAVENIYRNLSHRLCEEKSSSLPTFYTKRKIDHPVGCFGL